MTPEQQAVIDAVTARMQGGATTPAGQTFTTEQLKAMESAKSRIQSRGYDVIKTLDDGSQLLMLGDGSFSVVNQQAGFSSTDPAVIEAAQRGESPLQAAKVQRAETIIQQDPTGARAGQFVQGFPFVGSYMDELYGMATGDQRGVESRRLQSEAMQTARPGESTALQVAGGVTGGIPMGMAAGAAGGTKVLDRISRLPRGRKYLSYMLGGAGVGGTEGAIYGYGTGETPEQRQTEAIRGGRTGAMVGGATSVAMPAVINTFSTGFMNLKKAKSRQDVPSIARELGISNDAAKVIQSTMQQTDTDLADMLAAIDRAGEQGMIADADLAAQVLLDAAAATEGGAAAIVRSAVEGRARESGQALQGTLDETLAPLPRTQTGEVADVQDVAETIAAETRPQRQAAYNEAYSQPIDYTTDAGRRIESTIGRISPTTLRKAMQEANDAMRADGVGQRQIMADIDGDGNVTFIEMPNTVQVDYLKRALGQIAKETDNLGRQTAEAGRASRFYGELNQALGEAVPEYRVATSLGGDKIGRDNALDLGEKALNPSVGVRDVMRGLQGLDEGQRIYARVGLRQSIEDTLSKVRASIASPDVDINELRKVLSDLSSRANQSKVKAIIGPESAEKLFRELEKANAALSLRAAVARNSATAVRQSVQQQVSEITQPGAAEALMKGEPLSAAREVVRAVTGATGEYTQAQKSEIMREIARALTSARGEAAKNQLRTIYNAVKENRATDEQLQRASDLLINSVTLPATLFGTAAATRD